MEEKARIIASIQEDLDKIENGILLSIKLLNKDELNILIEDTDKIIKKFYFMVRKACEEIKDCKIIKTTDPTKIYIIVADDLRLAEKLAYSIYSQVQLYVDEEFPESYLKCSVGSIRFSPELNLNADKLISRLIYGILSSHDQSYYYCYDDNPINIDDIRDRNIKLNLLRSSILNKKAKFLYQPIIDRKTGDIEYYECLLRIPDKNNNFVSVGSIIKDAEKKNLINIVDFTVIEMVIRELYRDEKIKLSVNISNIGLLNKRLLKRIETLLKKYQVANRLIIEITETSLNYDLVATKNFINTLRSYGCRFALDDFGSGFTSFKQLINLPIDIIKIDGSYIRDVLINKHSRSFVEALIKLAADLGIRTVAEFVENGEIAKFLIEIKVDSMQGNFFLAASEKRI